MMISKIEKHKKNDLEIEFINTKQLVVDVFHTKYIIRFITKKVSRS